MFSSGELALVLIAMIWGTTFSLIQLALKDSGPIFIVGVRFLVAAILFGLVFVKSFGKIKRTDLVAGVSIGLAYCLTCVLQAYGLKSVPSSTSAFISAMYVPMVPLMQRLITGRAPSWVIWVSTSIAFVGIALLTAPSPSTGRIGTGELLTLGSAAAMALMIVLISHYSKTSSARLATGIQLITISFFSFLSMPLVGEFIPPPLTTNLLLITGGMGFFSVLISLTMNWAQQRPAKISWSRANPSYRLAWPLLASKTTT